MVEDRACPFRDHLPGNKIGVVLDFGGEDAISLLKVFEPPAKGHGVQRRGGSSYKDHFAWVVRSDELCNAPTGRFVRLCGSNGELVGTPVDVGVRRPGEAIHRFENRDWLLRRRT